MATAKQKQATKLNLAKARAARRKGKGGGVPSLGKADVFAAKRILSKRAKAAKKSKAAKKEKLRAAVIKHHKKQVVQ